MIDDRMIEKFTTIEKFLTELAGMRQRIFDLQLAEKRFQEEMEHVRESEGALRREAEERWRKRNEDIDRLLRDRSADLERVTGQLEAENENRKRIEEDREKAVAENRIIHEEIRESKLRENTYRYRFHFLADHLPIGLWVTLAERIVFANAKCLDILGFSAEELKLKAFSDLVHPDDAAMVRQRYTGWLTGKTPPNIFACRFVHKDGTIKWLENKIALVNWEENAAILSFVSDITDRKWARGELRHSIDQFHALMHSLEEILINWDREGC